MAEARIGLPNIRYDPVDISLRNGLAAQVIVLSPDALVEDKKLFSGYLAALEENSFLTDISESLGEMRGSLVALAVQDNKVIGTGGVSLQASFPLDGIYGYGALFLDNDSVLKEYQGLGVGTALINARLDAIKQGYFSRFISASTLEQLNSCGFRTSKKNLADAVSLENLTMLSEAENMSELGRISRSALDKGFTISDRAKSTLGLKSRAKLNIYDDSLEFDFMRSESYQLGDGQTKLTTDYEVKLIGFSQDETMEIIRQYRKMLPGEKIKRAKNDFIMKEGDGFGPARERLIDLVQQGYGAQVKTFSPGIGIESPDYVGKLSQARDSYDSFRPQKNQKYIKILESSTIRVAFTLN